MLSLDCSGTLAKLLTATFGISDQDIAGLKTPIKRYTEEWLKERELGNHAWSMDPYNKECIAEVQEVVKRVKAEKITTVVWVGIGGSGLGPRVLQECFESTKTPAFIVVDSVDPATIAMHLANIDWKSAFVVGVSKSGTTLETMAAFFTFFDVLQSTMKADARKRAIVITDPKENPLLAFAQKNKLYALPIPPAVGGRFSIFTPVGLLALGLLDADISAFVRGAKEMDDLCQETTITKNPAALLACVQYLLDAKKGLPLRVIMPYGDRLTSLARWCQQLLAESLGKNEISNPIPMAAIGTQDQHSLLQQWMSGPRKSWHLFLREADRPSCNLPRNLPQDFSYMAGKSFGDLIDACYVGTSRALTSAKRPHATIAIESLDAAHLGQLFFLFMTEVVYLGKLYRIDIYGQPGVEIGKKITKQLLTEMR